MLQKLLKSVGLATFQRVRETNIEVLKNTFSMLYITMPTFKYSI